MHSTVSQLFDCTDDDGYGGMDPNLYMAIVEFKKTGQYPSFIEDHQKVNRNAQFHWRVRCARFVLSISDTLLYVDRQNTERTRIVVRRGEVQIAIKILHERSGHAGQKHTQMLIARRLYWSGIRRDVTRFINECVFCKTKRELRKPALYEDSTLSPPCGTEEALVADRLLLNVAEPLVFEYVDDLDTYEEVVLEDIEEVDGVMFAHQQDNYERQKELGSILSDKVEVGAEEMIMPDEVIDMKNINTNAQMAGESSPAEIRHQNESRRRSIHADDPYLSEVSSRNKRRKAYENSDVHSERYEEEEHVEDEHQDQDYVHGYSLPSEPSIQHPTTSYQLDPTSTVNPTMIIAPGDAEVVRMQKSVLQLQYDVLSLKKQYLEEKLRIMRTAGNS